MNRRRIFLASVAVGILTLVPLAAAMAHGEPVIRVDPAIVAAGGSIIVTGTEMEVGLVFDLTLEGSTTSISLGEATAEGDGDEGGFVLTITLPVDLEPGSYTVRASTEEGESAIADLTITDAATEADPGPAQVEGPSGEAHLLPRTKPVTQIVGIAALAVALATVGVWLIRRR